MVKAIIYQPAKTAMQSGRGKSGLWLLEFEGAAPRQVEPLMGWTSSPDTQQQVQMNFESREAAVAFCDGRSLAYRIVVAQKRRPRLKSYADNFSSYTVRGPGTEPLPRP